MKAAVRTSAAVLHSTRRVPVTQCLVRRWQTTAAKPKSYEDMLEQMEVDFPDPTKAPSNSAPTAQRHVQPAGDAYTPSDAASAPAFDSFDTVTGTTHGEDTRPQRKPEPLTKAPGKKYGNVKPRFSDRSSTNNTTTQKPRLIPPPTFKSSSESITKQDILRMSPVRRVQSGPKTNEHAQVPEMPESSETQPFRNSPSKPSDVTTPQNFVAQDRDDPTAGLNPLETTMIATSESQSNLYDNVFLRDSCTCLHCVDRSTRQKRFDSADIPANISVRMIKYHGDIVRIAWKHDIPGSNPNHQTRLSRRWLQRALVKPVTNAYNDGKWAWNALKFKTKMVDFDYSEYMSDETVQFELIRQLHVLGLVFIKNVPESESSIVETANRIGPLKNTFYGDTWDVRSVSDAKNVAYTDGHLGFHMDLLYMQQPPRLQLLHCLRASTQGGVSLFSDSYKAAEQLNKLDHDALQALVETPVNFHYDNDNHHYFRSHRTFQLRNDHITLNKIERGQKWVWNSLHAVNWSPPFQAAFSNHAGTLDLATGVRKWHEAAQLFKNLTELEGAVYKRQMAPGECVIFDNRRVLHARTAFAGGERWLRGAYLDDDAYLSKIRVLERTHGDINSKYSWYSRE